MTTGEKIKSFRTKKGWSQEYLAELMGYQHKSSINKIEMGKSDLPQSKLLKFAEIFGIEPQELLDISATNEKEDRHEFKSSVVTYPINTIFNLPVIASVRAGYDGVAVEEYQGFEFAYDLKNPEEYVWFRVEGDSMAPLIMNGDLALVRKQSDVDNGDIAIVIYNGDIGTIKKVIKNKNAITLMPLNSEYEAKMIVGEELNQIWIYGKVVEIKRKLN